MRIGVEGSTRILESRPSRADLAPDPKLPDDTRIWAALQAVSGGTWGGAVYDAAAILRVLEAGKRAVAEEQRGTREVEDVGVGHDDH